MGEKADSEIKIKFTTEHDGSGADAAHKKIDETKKKAGEAAGGFGQLEQSMSMVHKTMKKVNEVFAGLGILGVVMTVVNAVKGLHEWLNASKERAKELNEEAGKAADVKAVGKLAADYKKLADNINLAKEAALRMRDIGDIHIANQRSLEDAQSALSEENEIAGIKYDDPERDQKKSVIQKEYARKRALTDVQRKQEDVGRDYNKLNADAAMSEGEAGVKEKSLPEDDRLIEETKKKLAVERQKTKAKKFSITRYAITKLPSIGGKIAAASGMSAMTDDVEVQDKARKEVPVLEDRLKSLQDARDAKEADIAAQRAKAEFSRQKAEATFGGFAALGVQRTFEDKSGNRAADEAQDEVDKAARERRRDEADLAKALRDKAAAEKRERELKGGLKSATASTEKEERDAWAAKNALDMHAANRPANGGGRRWSESDTALRSKWEKEQSEAGAAAKELKELGEYTSKALQTVAAAASAAKEKIKATSEKLDKDHYGDKGASQ